MWTYYGTKKALAQYYPCPIYPVIIEPFAGAARYSLHGDNWKREVHLYDKYEVIVKIWNYLFNASEQDILSLPDMNVGDSIDSHSELCDEERWLIGFCINSASAVPKKTVQARTQWNRSKVDIANNLFKIRHWTAEVLDYSGVPNFSGTWFIDPPYQHGGIYYRVNNSKLNYLDLAEWCLSRQGQVIVCENSKANWLPFRPLAELRGQLHKTQEVVYVFDTERVHLNATSK